MKNINKKKNNTTTILIILLSVILLSSVLAVFFEGESKKTINVYVAYYIMSQEYPASSVKTDENITLYNFLGSLMKSIELTQEGDVKCLGQYCNNFLQDTAWTVFLNGYPETDLAKILAEGDYITLYFGRALTFGNITVSLNVLGSEQNSQVLIREDMTINDLLSNTGYDAVFNNNTLNCLFSLCSNINNSWTVLKNNQTVINYNSTLSIGDSLTINYN